MKRSKRLTRTQLVGTLRWDVLHTREQAIAEARARYRSATDIMQRTRVLAARFRRAQRIAKRRALRAAELWLR